MTMLEIGTFNLAHVLIYAFIWSTLYFLLCLRDSKRSYEWHCRVVTAIHASVIAALAFYGVFALGPWPWSEAGGPNVPHEVRTCTICLGYFIFDIAWCLYHKTEGPIMLTHHTLSIVGLTWCLIAGKYGTELVATIGGAEITNPLLQARWFMKEMGYYNTIWGDVLDLTFMLSFGFVRIILGSYLLYRYFQQPTDFLGRLGGTLIYLIGWAFFISIVQYGLYRSTKRYQEWEQRKMQKKHSVSSTTLDHNVHHSTSDNGLMCNNGATASGNATSDSSSSSKSVTVIGEKEIPTQREIKHRDGVLTVRKNCVVKES